MRKPQLFLLHFAGGNRYSFQFMLHLLGEFEVFTLELPGRGKRMSEDLLKDFELAARDIYQQLMQNLETSFVLYGHSMGAYLALKVCDMLEKAGRMPAYLIVSGNAGPGIGADKKRYLLEHHAFVEELQLLGGIPDELIHDRELFEFFEPILRADFEIAENNALKDQIVVKAPLYAIMGSDEEQADHIANWGKFTRSQFSYEIMEGDHFFIYKHPRKLAAVIKSCYQSALSGPLQKWAK